MMSLSHQLTGLARTHAVSSSRLPGNATQIPEVSAIIYRTLRYITSISTFSFIGMHSRAQHPNGPCLRHIGNAYHTQLTSLQAHISLYRWGYHWILPDASTVLTHILLRIFDNTVVFVCELHVQDYVCRINRKTCPGSPLAVSITYFAES